MAKQNPHLHFSESSRISANGTIIHPLLRPNTWVILILFYLSSNSRKFIIKIRDLAFKVDITSAAHHLHCYYPSLNHAIFNTIVENCDSLLTSSLISNLLTMP